MAERDRMITCPIHNVHMKDCFIAHHSEAFQDEALGQREYEALIEEQHIGLQEGTLKWFNGEIVPVEMPEPEIIVLEVPVQVPIREATPGHGSSCVCSQCCANGFIQQQMGEFG
jgi:hypothetical protein